jgi:predicted dithiol-disulfide oxidoreductase (DUF899 family)
MAKKTKMKAASAAKKSASPALHDVRFPGESAKYRASRDKLLKREVALRREAEAVAAERRKLPVGGPLKEDYVFEGADGPVRLSELFAPGKDTLLVYNFMFGPQDAAPCPLCSSILDGLDGQVQHATERVNVAVVAKSPLARITSFANSRGWRRLRLLSSAANTYNRDYHGENEKGAQQPMMNVFTRQDGRIRHRWATEMFFAAADRGEHPRHVDSIWPLWNLFDMTPEGRGASWYPKLRYE